MVTIKEFLEATNYNITGGTDYGWKCFGPNARYLDCDVEDKFSTNCIFDSVTKTIYTIEAWDYDNNREYRWINPEYLNVLKEEYEERECQFSESSDGRKFIDLEVPDDILEKISDMHNGKVYDTRVKVPVDFSDEDLLKYMKLAHEMDITFNAFIELALREAMEREGILVGN